MVKIRENKGSLAMIIGSINYALYPVILSIAIFSDFTSGKDMSTKFLWGFVLVGIKELFNLFFQLIYVGVKNASMEKGFMNRIRSSVYSVYKIYKDIFINRLSNRYGWLVVFAAFLAGPIGYSIETIGVLFSGPSIGTLLISLLPIFMLAFTKVLFKETKIDKWIILLAIAITLTVVGNGLAQFYTSNSINQENVAIGLVCGLITGVLWASENIIMSYVTKKKDMDHNEVIVIKLSSSAILVPLLLIPIVGVLTKGVGTGYEWYGDMYTNYEWLGWMFLIGLVMFMARWLYFYSIKHSASIISSMTLVIRFAWIPILQLVLFPIVGKSLSNVNWAYFIPLSILAWGLTISMIFREYKINVIFTKNNAELKGVVND